MSFGFFDMSKKAPILAINFKSMNQENQKMTVKIIDAKDSLSFGLFCGLLVFNLAMSAVPGSRGVLVKASEGSVVMSRVNATMFSGV